MLFLLLLIAAAVCICMLHKDGKEFANSSLSDARIIMRYARMKVRLFNVLKCIAFLVIARIVVYLITDIYSMIWFWFIM